MYEPLWLTEYEFRRRQKCRLIIFVTTISSPPKATTDKGDSKGGKKGGKTPAAAVQPTPEELRTDPPVERELGSAVVQLKQFLEGSSEFVSRTLYCGGGPEPDQTTKEQLINHIEVEYERFSSVCTFC